MTRWEDEQEAMVAIRGNSDLALLNGLTPQETSSRKGIEGRTAIQLPKESEQDFQQRVIELAHLKRWRVCEFRKARVKRDGQDVYRTPFGADGKGMLDLILVRERVLWRELKSEKGQLSGEQKLWISWLKNAGQDVKVWRPSMWKQIVKELD